MFRTKHNPNGSIERRKARLFAKDFHQQEGVDYAKTFSLVVKPTTIYVVPLSCCVSQMATSPTQHPKRLPLWRSHKNCTSTCPRRLGLFTLNILNTCVSCTRLFTTLKNHLMLGLLNSPPPYVSMAFFLLKLTRPFSFTHLNPFLSMF